MSTARLGAAFFARPTLWVAPRLLGRLLVHETPEGPLGGRIVEVEAYLGPEDRASHATAGRTRRNASMWGPPGRAYVYFTYGMHHCLNLVTEADGRAGAVLIRALEPTVGVERLAERVPHLPPRIRLSGPGRLCAGLGIGREHDGLDLAAGTLWIGRGRRAVPRVLRAPRVGVREGGEVPWRFLVAGHPSVSGPRGLGAALGLARPAGRKLRGRQHFTRG